MSAIAAPQPAAGPPGARYVRQRTWRAFWSALGLEVTLLLVALAWLATPPIQIPTPVIPLTLETLETLLPIPALDPVKATPPPTVPAHPVRAVVPVPARHTPQPAVPVARPPDQPVPPSPSVAPTVSAAPAEAPVAPAPSPPTTPPAAPSVAAAADVATAYNAKIAAAVQAAFQVPMAASALAFKGRVRVEFVLHDGRAGTARVVLGSGLGAVDEAALRAVRSAAYPPPPATLASQDGSYQIWVACY